MTIIHAGDLSLRTVEKTDAQRFAYLCNDESLARYTSRIPHPYTLEHAQGFVEKSARELEEQGEFRFAVCRNDEIIACTGVTPTEDGVFDLGYWVGADYRGQGVATLAAAAIIAFFFERHNAKRITAGHFVDNPASGHILGKLGFRPTGKSKMLISKARDEEVETVLLSLTLEDFQRPASVRFET